MDSLKKGGMWTVALGVNVVNLGLCMVIAVLAIMYAGNLSAYMSAIEGFDNSSLFYVILFMGLSYALLHAFGAFLCFLSTDPIKRKVLRKQLMAYTSWIVSIAVAALLTFMFIYSYTGSLDNVFSRGILGIMPNYKMDPPTKTLIDRIQLDLQCCGNNNMSDWFKVLWADLPVTAVAIPASCCSVAAGKGVCVTTTTVNNVGAITAFDSGCAKALQAYFVSTCTAQGYLALLLFFFEGALCGLLVYVILIADAMKKKMQEKEKEENKKLLKKSSSKLKGSTSKSKTKPRKRESRASLEKTTPAHTTDDATSAMTSEQPYAYDPYQQPHGYTMPFGLNDHSGYYNQPGQF